MHCISGESDDESEVLTQECISQLTALMDIPMLDGILQTTLETAQQMSRCDKVKGLHFINQRMLNRFESIAVIMSEGDKWRQVRNCYDCLIVVCLEIHFGLINNEGKLTLWKGGHRIWFL